jgi:hypothetical protein
VTEVDIVGIVPRTILSGAFGKRALHFRENEGLSLDPHIKTMSFSIEGLVFRPANPAHLKVRATNISV